MFSLLDGQGDVDHGKEAENKSLDKRYENPQEHGQRGKKKGQNQWGGKRQGKQHVVRHYITEKTHGEGQHPCKIAYKFNGSHQRGEPQNGAEEMLQVFDSMGFEPVIMAGNEYHKGAGHCRIQVIRGRHKPRHQSKQVGE